MGVDLMKFDEIQEEIQRYSKAAGAGNFDRTAFEYSPEILPDVSAGSSASLIIAKFIAPESGVYKYEFYCKGNASRETYIKREYFECPPALCAYQGTGQVAYKVIPYQNLHTYIDKNIGQMTPYMYWSNIGNDNTNTLFGDYIKPMIPAKITSYTKFTLYFSARKGEAIVMHLVPYISDADSPSRHSVKNQKITY